MIERRRIMLLPEGAITEGSKAPACSILFVNNADTSVKACFTESNWPDANEWTPIGIVVVPGPHNRYGDGTCGVMSLVYMDPNHPETGFTDYTKYVSGMKYGSFGDQQHAGSDTNVHYIIDSLELRQTYLPYHNPVPNNGLGRYDSLNIEWPYTFSNGVITNNASNLLGTYVGLYNNNEYNALGRFDGLIATWEVILNWDSDYNYPYAPGWTSSTIDQSNNYNTPAYLTCARFHTVGTDSMILRCIDTNVTTYLKLKKTSDNKNICNLMTSTTYLFGGNHSPEEDKEYRTNVWYLPAPGELSYIPPKWMEIGSTLMNLNVKYGHVLTITENKNFSWPTSFRLCWSSIGAWDADYVWVVGSEIEPEDKNDSNFAVAFMRW